MGQELTDALHDAGKVPTQVKIVVWMKVATNTKGLEACW